MSNSKLFQGLSLILAAFSEMVAADVAEIMLREMADKVVPAMPVTKQVKAEAKTKSEKPKEEPVSEEKPDKVTAESLRGKASELIDADRDALIKILKKNKVKRVSECPEEKLEAVYNDIVAALEEATCL